ncbi:hypothetical protein FRC04_007447 [Tulasnella sp. 424]|nr:hypothetical protein FRC04_007447 [Tulasnella sp. 424]
MIKSSPDIYDDEELSSQSPSDSDSDSQPEPEVLRKLVKLEKWRLGWDSVEFPEGVRERHGGHATVCIALFRRPVCNENPSQPKYVAVKKLKTNDDSAYVRLLRSLTREVEMLDCISHPHVVKLEGFIENPAEGAAWLVFTWEANGNVREFLASGIWEIPERISLIRDTACGLEYLHGHNPPIRHGDLKSLNILVNAEYRAVITDFGSARLLTDVPLSTSTDDEEALTTILNQPADDGSPRATYSEHTKQMTISNCEYTLRWAAPEVLLGEESDLSSDIWALGWIIYELLTDDFPFKEVKLDAAVIKRVIEGVLPSIAKDQRFSPIPALCNLITSCWKQNPTDRPTPTSIPTPSTPLVKGSIRVRSPALLLQLGWLHRRQDNYQDAMASYMEVVGICTRSGDESGRAQALWGVAEVYRLQDMYDKALSSYTEALRLFRRVGDEPGRAQALWGLADVYRYQALYEQADFYYNRALQICTQNTIESGIADALWGLAEVHRLQARYSDAASDYNRALQICSRLGNESGKAQALWGLADVSRLEGRYEEASSFYHDALRSFTQIGDESGSAQALWGLGEVWRFQAKYVEAASSYSQALQIFSRIGIEGGRAQALWGLAEVHRSRNQEAGSKGG